MRKWVLGGLVVAAVAFAAWLAIAEYAAYNDPKSSVLAAGTQCVVTGEGVVRAESGVLFEADDDKWPRSVAPGVMVRVGGDPAAKDGKQSWMRQVPVVIESGEAKGASGHISREFLRPVR